METGRCPHCGHITIKAARNTEVCLNEKCKQVISKAAAEPNILTEPTNEYSMRHAANLIQNAFGHGTVNSQTMSAGDLEVINFAYQQLHRGANMLSGNHD